VITLHKWYPFVHPSPHDIREMAIEKRAERLQFEYDQALKGHKVRLKVHDLEVELYDKRARQHTIELSMFKDRKRVDIFV
jgi:hypothetical protein